jgi:hypothetical protein
MQVVERDLQATDGGSANGKGIKKTRDAFAILSTR